MQVHKETKKRRLHRKRKTFPCRCARFQSGCVTLIDLGLTPHEKVHKRSLRVKGYQRAYHTLQGNNSGFRDRWVYSDSRQSERVCVCVCVCVCLCM